VYEIFYNSDVLIK